MKGIISLRLSETRRAIILLQFFKLLLDSLVVFAFLYIPYIFFDFNINFLVIPTAVFFIIKLIKIMTDSHISEKIVKKYPSLDERLQTAFDNQLKPNLITDKLIAYVASEMSSISYSAFFGAGRITLSVISVTILLFAAPTVIKYKEAVVSLPKTISNQFNDYFFPGNDNGGGSDTMSMGGGKEWERGNHSNKKETEKIGGAYGGKAPGFSEGPLAGTGGGTGETDNQNLYGAPTSARIEGQNVKMEVHPEYGGEVDIEDTRKPSDTRSFNPLESVDSAASDRSQDPVEYEEVIRSYFKKLSSEGGK